MANWRTETDRQTQRADNSSY